MQGSLMVDIAGTWLTAEDRQLLRQPEVGGLILFTRNIETPGQVRELCRAIRAVRPELLLAVDQEGGRVQRLRRDVVRLPAMGQLGARADSTELARLCGWLMATEILAVGLDFSFAPVLDVDHGRSQVIGARSFGSAEQVIELGGAFIAGMGDAGMAATGKHFPGHGWAEADSHYAIPTDDRDLDTLLRTDLRPFQALLPTLGAVMPAHVIYPAVDPQPAGFSRRWLQDILRGELDYQGVIFSDDLSMAGAHVAGDAGQRVEAALTAGCDMGLVCNDRAAAELALTRVQQLGVSPSPRLASMKARRHVDLDYRQQPQWSYTLQRLRQAELI